jgi:gliding motility-associated-like protein
MVTFPLSVVDTVSFSYNQQICTGSSYFFDGQYLTISETYTKIVPSSSGCDSVIVLSLDVMDCVEIEIPIFFTPNVDGVNEKWEIKNISHYEHVVEIFDRFGKLLQRWENNFTGWDGTYNGRPMPSADYWYRIIINDKESYAGHFTLLR